LVVAAFAVCAFSLSLPNSLLMNNKMKARQTSDTCTSPIPLGASCASQPYYCDTGLTCINGTCDYQTLGSICTTDSDCSGSLYDTCINGKCDVVRGPGDPCTSTAQCAASATCDSGSCTALTEGTACNGGDCAPGLYCNSTYICARAIPLGTPCSSEYIALSSQNRYDDIYSVCASSVCNFYISGGVNIEGNCTTVESIPLGGPCSSPFVCASGLTCNVTAFQCETAQSGGNCSDSTGCTNTFDECKCSSNTTGVCTATTCDVLPLYKCMVQNNCGLRVQTAVISGSCAAPCLADLATYECCAYSHPDQGVTCSTTSGSNSGSNTGSNTATTASQTTGNNGSGAAALAVSAVVLTASAMITMF